MAEKTISELTPIVQLSDDALFVVEQNGESGSVKASQLGGGMPPATEDGSALIAVANEWKQQAGYGYSAPLTVTWDGDTTGLESFTDSAMTYYKVSELSFTKAELDDPVTGVMHRATGDGAISIAKTRMTETANELNLYNYAWFLYSGSSKGSAGLYFVSAGDAGHLKELTLKTINNKISRDLLPDHIYMENGALMQGGVDVTNAVKAALGIT